MATFEIDLADDDEQTVIDALAFNAGYNADVDGDKRDFAVASIIKHVSDIVKAVSIYNIRAAKEIEINEAVNALPSVILVDPVAEAKTNGADPIVVSPVIP